MLLCVLLAACIPGCTLSEKKTQTWHYLDTIQSANICFVKITKIESLLGISEPKKVQFAGRLLNPTANSVHSSRTMYKSIESCYFEGGMANWTFPVGTYTNAKKYSCCNGK